MIEVVAFLNRGSVYLAGETIQCTINFVNVSSTSKGNPRCIDTLAWASAQVHCQCTIREQGALSTKSQDASTGGSSGMTYFYPTKGEEGCTVIATEPKIIFCDLRLAPGESRTFVYQQQLPKDAVPSFRGRYVKYAYKVTIGTQRPDSQIKLMRIPFRVLLVPDMANHNVYGDKKHDLKPSNPFLALGSAEDTTADASSEHASAAVLDGALQALAMLTSRRSPHHYNISTSKGKVAKFSIFKHNYKIGDDVLGLMDFSDATVPCLKFSVSLQSEETPLQGQEPLLNGLRPVVSGSASASAAAGSSSGGSNAVVARLPPVCVCHGSHEEFALHVRRTSFSLPVPVAATPGFSTDVVQLKWHLHFKFVTVSSPTLSRSVVGSPTAEDPAKGDLWTGKLELDTETTEWDLPLKVLATSPLLCYPVPPPRSPAMLPGHESVLV